jgi:hypothetical protein
MIGYTESEGYAASVRQQADWVMKGEDCDVDELREAANLIDRQAARIAALETALRNFKDKCK